ncbi:MFS transporter [Halobacteriales archaeon QS_1_68_20]|nr:MAG: MFS transporter [Halobacteriales archaeon QS_1_68_20]
MVFLVNLSRVIYAPLVEPLRAAFDADPGTVGTVVTLVWIGSALPRVPTGYLLTRVPRHHVVLGSGVVLTLAATFATTANSVPTLAVGALLMGLASGAYFVSANPLVSELYPDRVGRAMGLHGGASQVAAVVAAPIVTVALLVGTWRTIFAGIAVLAAAVTLVLFVVARRTTLPEASGADRDLLGAVRAQWRLVAAGVLVLGVTGFVWQGIFNFYVSYAVAMKGLTEAAGRNLLTVVFLAGLPGFLVSGRLVDRFPSVPYILGILVAFVGTVLVLTVVEGLALVAVTAVLGFVIHSLFPAIDTFLLGTLPDEHRGGAYAVYSGAMMLTQASGSSAVGQLVERGVPYDVVFGGFAVGLAVLVAGLGLLWAVGRFPGAERGRPASAG